MAADPKDGVVDKDCRVFGTDNLYIAGSSIFPTGGSAHPTLNLIALALRLADHLAKRLKEAIKPAVIEVSMQNPNLAQFRETIKPDWIDYNGHLNEAYYLLIFSHATDALIDWIGMEAAYREANGLSIYTLETHIIYALEVKQGEEVEVKTRLLDLD